MTTATITTTATVNPTAIDSAFVDRLNLCGDLIADLAAAETAKKDVVDRLKKGKLSDSEKIAYDKALDRVIIDGVAVENQRGAADKLFLRPWSEAVKAAKYKSESAAQLTIAQYQPMNSGVVYGDFDTIDVAYLLKMTGILSDGQLVGKQAKKVEKLVAAVCNRAYLRRASGETTLTMNRIKNTWTEVILALTMGLLDMKAIQYDGGKLTVYQYTEK